MNSEQLEALAKDLSCIVQNQRVIAKMIVELSKQMADFWGVDGAAIRGNKLDRSQIMTMILRD